MKNIILLLTVISFTFTAYSQSVAEDFYKQAKQYSSDGDVAKAVEYYSKTIEADPKFINAYFNRGSILAQQKKYKAALDDFKNFDKISPNDFEVEYLMAACYYYLGEKSTSFDLVNKSINGNRQYFESYKLRATLLLDKGDYQTAIEDYIKAIEINKNDPETYNLRGFCYEKINNNEQALKDYYMAEKMGLSNVLVYNNIGNVLSYQKNYNKALIYFGKAIAMDENYALSYYNRGVVYNNLGFSDLAIKDWKTAKKLKYNLFDDEIKKLIE